MHADERYGPAGEYRIVRVLHASGQLLTAEACTPDGSPVVLKQLRIAKLQSWKALELFERQVQLLKLLDHPQLPRWIADFRAETERETHLFLICSWAPGESLLDRLASGWRPTEAEALALARQVLELLRYLHSFQPPILHRDLKPGNLILAPDGRLQLVDFGAVQGVLNPDGGSTVVGTFGYMPPEQFSDRCVPASDLYALGASLVHLLSGKYPSDLPRKGMRLLFRPVLNGQPALLDWLDRLLTPEVEQRFQTAAAATAALDELSDARLSVRRADRFEVMARGSGCKITVAPAGLRSWLAPRNLLRPSHLWGALLIGWGAGLLTQGVAGLVLGGLLMLLGVSTWIQTLIASQIQLQIQLQPERYVLLQSLGRFRRRIEGTPSELQRLDARPQPLTGLKRARWVERSGLEHTLLAQLQNWERHVLAGHLARFLLPTAPAQAERMLNATFDPPLEGILRDLDQLSRKLTGQRFWLQRRLATLTKHLPASVRGYFSTRLNLPAADAAREMRLRARGPGLVWFLRLGWLAGWGKYVLIEWLPVAKDYEVLGLVLLSWPCFVVPLFRAVSAFVGTSLRLEADRYVIVQRFLGWRRVYSGELVEWADLAIPAWGSHRNALRLTLRDGRHLSLAYDLSLRDRQQLLAWLGTALESRGLLPHLPAFLRSWEQRFTAWRMAAEGRTRRLQITLEGPRRLLHLPPRGSEGGLLGLSLLSGALTLGAPFGLVLLSSAGLFSLNLFYGLLALMAAGALVSSLCLALSRVETTLRLEPGRIEVGHQLGGMHWRRVLKPETAGGALQTAPSTLGLLRLQVQTTPGRTRTLIAGFGVSPADRQQFSEMLAQPVSATELPTAQGMLSAEGLSQRPGEKSA